MAPIFNFHFYEGKSSSPARGSVRGTTRELQALTALTDRRRSRSRRRRRDSSQQAPPTRWIGSITRSPPPLTDLPGSGRPAKETNPQTVSYSTHVRSEYPPEEWLGSNHLQSNIPKDSSNALAILDTPPGDLRSRSAPEQSTPANSSHEHPAPLPPPTTPPPADNFNTAPPATFPLPPPPPPLPPTPKVIEPMLSPFRPTVGGLAGFLQRASHANIPPPTSLTPTSSTQVLDDLKYNKKGEPKSYPAQDSGEDDLAYSIRLANWIPLNYDWPSLGQVPSASVPRVIFYLFEFSQLRTMEQRKQFTQEELDGQGAFVYSW